MSNTGDYSNYTYQKDVYAYFTNVASFNANPSYPSDISIFLNGTELVVDNLSTDHSFGQGNDYYPVTLTKECSIKAFSYITGVNTRWRIYAVNHTTGSSVNLTADITGTPASVTAYKRDTTNYVTLQNQGGSKFRLIDTLTANACQFYDAG